MHETVMQQDISSEPIYMHQWSGGGGAYSMDAVPILLDKDLIIWFFSLFLCTCRYSG